MGLSRVVYGRDHNAILIKILYSLHYAEGREAPE